MPAISSKIIRYAAQDWLAGLSPQYTISVDAAPSLAEPGATVMRGVDPFRALGYLTTAPLADSVTNDTEIDNVLLNIAYGEESSTQYGYLVESGDEIHRLQLSNFTISNSSPWPHQVSGTGTVTLDDCISYPLNVGGNRERCILYSWNDSGGAWDIGVFNTEDNTFGTDGFDDDWLTNVPADAPTTSGNAKRHPMILGRDDVVYVADGNKVHGIDGAQGSNSTFIDSLLTLPADMRITAFAKLDNYLVVFAYQHNAGDILLTSATSATQNATAYFWNYLDLDPTFVVPLNDDFVSSAISYKNTVACFTSGAKPVREINGADRTGRLKIWDGTKFETVAQYIGTPPSWGGSHIVNDSIQWLTRQGTDLNVYSYGSPYENVSAGMMILYDCTGTNSTPGVFAVTPGATGYPIASSGGGATGGLERFRSDNAASALYVSGAATPQLGPGDIAQVKSVTVYFADTMTSAGRAVTVQLISEDGTSTTVISALDQITDSNLVTKKEFTTSGGQLPRFQELRLSVSYGSGSSADEAPIIRYVDVEYEVKNAYI